MKIHHIRPHGFRTKLALEVGLLFLTMLALAIVVQNISLDRAFSRQITVGHSVGTESLPDTPNDSGNQDDIKNKNEACQGHGCPQAAEPGIDDASPHQEHEDNKGTTLSGEVQVVKDSVTTWMWYSSLAVFALFGLLALTLIWKLTGTLVEQLDSISQQAANLDLDHPGGRIFIDNPHDEIASMANTLNAMLNRMEKSNQAQKAFVRNASHELRTPITTIGTSLESLINQKRISPDAEPMVKRAIESNHKSANLITVLLELSRIQGTTISKSQPIDVDKLTRSLLLSHQQEIQDQKLTLDLSGLLPTRVITDPQYAEIALDNLIRNAIVHNIPEGNITISTEFVNTDSENKSISLTIANSTAEEQPVGMVDPEELTSCFYRGNSTRIANKPGYGLGLSIVREIANILGLRLSLRYPEEGAFQATMVFPNGDLQ
ncbi:sensor histidine kinase [Bombiscardovia coagulans]|uniref:histidine kinase n=1 Tax=Bombiscardovia coagulans TaxID=686666 RepID=A0A261EPJ1_9BIFI|nr:HAMP domain-containing sensor histidine kinase [Bombiscardovia coagulans]OZG48772.1 two-component system sensor histidine kinase [Bombiscardovia coagulans]